MGGMKEQIRADTIIAMDKKIKKLKDELTRQKRLAEYAQHLKDCNPRPDENDCKCGYLQALKGK